MAQCKYRSVKYRTFEFKTQITADDRLIKQISSASNKGLTKTNTPLPYYWTHYI